MEDIENTKESTKEGKELLFLLVTDLDSNFAYLMDKYNEQLCRFAWQQTGNQQDAEDIVQNTWIRIYQSLLKYPAEKLFSMNIGAWIFAILRNQLRDYFKKKKKSGTSSLDVLSDNELKGTEEAQPEWAYEQEEALSGIKDGLLELPDRSREVLSLVGEGLTYEEVSTRLDLSIGNIRTIMSRGRKQLRKQFMEPRGERNW